MAGELSILGAVARLAEMSLAIEVEQRRALDRAAKIVQDEAKREIGDYQQEGGAFERGLPRPQASSVYGARWH